MFATGARVKAQWTDGQWYPATITQAGKGQYFVTWDDGYTGWLAPHQVQGLTPAPSGAPAGALGLGSRVRSEYEGEWYAGTIRQVGDGGFLVRYDDGEEVWKAAHELVAEAGGGFAKDDGQGFAAKGAPAFDPKGGAPAFGAPDASGLPQVGTRVSAQWTDGKWYPATVTQAGKGQCFVTWDDGYTGWLAPHQVQPVAVAKMPVAPAPATLGVGSRVSAQWTDGKWYPAKVTQVASGQYFVTWDDGYTGWLAPHQVQPT